MKIRIFYLLPCLLLVVCCLFSCQMGIFFNSSPTENISLQPSDTSSEDIPDSSAEYDSSTENSSPVSSSESNETSSDSTSDSTSVPPDDSETANHSPALYPEDPVFLTDLSSYEEYMNPQERDAYLLLVNPTHLLTKDDIPDDLIEVIDTRKDRSPEKMRLYPAKALEAMFIELRANGYTDVSVTSAYRSYNTQNYLYNLYTENEMNENPSLTREDAEKIVSTYSARPGTSEHQSGLCADLHNLPYADVAFAEEEAAQWLAENCWKFGFIVRFPLGKEEITTYNYEPWHFRYVGRYHAYQIDQSNLCLEEYLEIYFQEKNG